MVSAAIAERASGEPARSSTHAAATALATRTAATSAARQRPGGCLTDQVSNGDAVP